jgi:hypothetical protein
MCAEIDLVDLQCIRMTGADVRAECYQDLLISEFVARTACIVVNSRSCLIGRVVVASRSICRCICVGVVFS